MGERAERSSARRIGCWGMAVVAVLALGISGFWVASLFPGVKYRVNVHSVSTTVIVNGEADVIGQQAPDTTFLIEKLKNAEAPISVELVLRTNMTEGRWFTEVDRTDIERFEFAIKREGAEYVLYSVKSGKLRALERNRDVTAIAARLAKECETQFKWAHMRQW